MYSGEKKCAVTWHEGNRLLFDDSFTVGTCFGSVGVVDSVCYEEHVLRSLVLIVVVVVVEVRGCMRSVCIECLWCGHLTEDRLR